MCNIMVSRCEAWWQVARTSQSLLALSEGNHRVLLWKLNLPSVCEDPGTTENRKYFLHFSGACRFILNCLKAKKHTNIFLLMEILYKNQLLPSECRCPVQSTTVVREMMETVNVFGDKASVYRHWTSLGDLCKDSSALEFNWSQNHWLCELGEILSKIYVSLQFKTCSLVKLMS